jgi:VanZ family protein
MTRPRFTKAFRVVFALYAVTLVALTHWPRLELPTDIIERPDLVAHVGAFGLLNLLMIAASYFGPALSTRNIARASLVCAIYAPIDELTQSLPGVNRHTSGLDVLADLVGVALAALAALALARIRQRRPAPTVDDPPS